MTDSRMAGRLLAGAVLWSALVLIMSLVLGPDALVFGVPPIAVCLVSGALVVAGVRFRSRPPIVAAMVVALLALAVAAVSFVTPLLAAMFPTTALVTGCCVNLLTAPPGPVNTTQ